MNVEQFLERLQGDKMAAFNEQEYQTVILGALLHDIGKFIQRAQENPAKQDHSHWGDEWFQNHLAERLTYIFNDKEKQTIRSAINNHHEHEEIISLADAISAGMDRIALDDEEKGDPFTHRLKAIMTQVGHTEEHKSTGFHTIKLLGKDNLNEIFPDSNEKCSFKEYSALLNDFEKELSRLDLSGLTPLQFIDYIYSLLWKYTWCIPSAAYLHEPDVSLFDHLKTSAAIAGCLYVYEKTKGIKSTNIDDLAFLLVVGDISGIQSYIFDVLTQQGKVAKRLRARSLFTQLISEIASHRILHSLNMPLLNVISSAGGNFYILAANTDDNRKKLEELQVEFDRWLFTNLRAELSLNLAYITLSGNDLKNFSQKLKGLKTILNRKKYQPFRSILCNSKNWDENKFVRPEVIESDEKICNGCHKASMIENVFNEDGLCENCWSDTQIGQKLPQSNYLAFFADSNHDFTILNYSFELWNENDIKKKIYDKAPYLILKLNDTEISPPVTGFKYLSTHIPTKQDIPDANVEKDNQPVAFDDIAGKANGDKLIAYAKGDVDNLGKILETPFSLSKFTTFSRMLETFFSGYLNKTLTGDYRTLYSVYSGGDDFFLIGPWDETIKFMKFLRSKFHEFCMGNPSFTFSTGVLLSKPHEPLSFCAKNVEEQLKSSKHRKDKEGKEVKDGITLFGQTVNWAELDNILENANKVIEWLKRQPPVISRSFAHNMRIYGEMAELSGITDDIIIKTELLRFIPLFTYDINRNLSKEEQKEAYQWATNLLPSLETPKGGNTLRHLKTIMGYVLTFTRS